MTRSILRLDASMRHAGSVSRRLTDAALARLTAAHPGATVVTRDLAQGLPFIDDTWVGATFTPPDQRSPAQAAGLALSDTLVAELQAADTLLIGTPVYNFGVPAALKAWVDQIVRVGVTFKYTETGPVGLLTGKRAILLVATGGTEIDSGIDYATPYLRFVLGFVGITDVTVVGAAKLLGEADGGVKAVAAAEAQIAALAV